MLGIDSANFGIIKSNLSVLPNFAHALEDELPPREVHSPLFGTIRGLDDTGPRGHHRSEGFMITLDPDAERGTEAPPMQVGEIAPLVPAPAPVLAAGRIG